MDQDHFSNLSFTCPKGSTWNLSNIGPEASEEKSFEIINIFSIQMYGTQTNAEGEANLTSP